MKYKGFTIIESMLALSIFIIVTVLPMSIIINAFQSNIAGKDFTIAHFASNEVLEYARSVRDSNFISGRSWLDGLVQCENNVCSVLIADACEIPECFVAGFEATSLPPVDQFCDESSYVYVADDHQRLLQNRTFRIKSSGESASRFSVIVESCVLWSTEAGEILKVRGKEIFYKWIVSD